jgi:hypothetical protein
VKYFLFHIIFFLISAIGVGWYYFQKPQMVYELEYIEPITEEKYFVPQIEDIFSDSLNIFTDSLNSGGYYLYDRITSSENEQPNIYYYYYHVVEQPKPSFLGSVQSIIVLLGTLLNIILGVFQLRDRKLSKK